MDVPAPLDIIAAAVRRERIRLGLSLSALARTAELSKATLSQVETGSGNPSVETLWALSVALGVPFSVLVAPPQPPIQILRAGEGISTHSEEADYIATLLASCSPQARCDIYRAIAQPGRQRQSDPHLPGTVEHVIIATGRALVGLHDEQTELAPGDYIRYRGDVRHVFNPLESDTSAIFILEQP
jgi:transcriptional regulator with XRE-family HTH domain